MCTFQTMVGQFMNFTLPRCGHIQNVKRIGTYNESCFPDADSMLLCLLRMCRGSSQSLHQTVDGCLSNHEVLGQTEPGVPTLWRPSVGSDFLQPTLACQRQLTVKRNSGFKSLLRALEKGMGMQKGGTGDRSQGIAPSYQKEGSCGQYVTCIAPPPLGSSQFEAF